MDLRNRLMRLEQLFDRPSRDPDHASFFRMLIERQAIPLPAEHLNDTEATVKRWLAHGVGWARNAEPEVS
jgi:hypothetical protein